MGSRIRWTIAAVLGSAGLLSGPALVSLAVAAPAAAAQRPSLPSVTSGARPGPDLLYAPAPAAPQLENTGVWKAQPILVSGAEAQRDGEFLYQDFLFDDRGAEGIPDPTDPFVDAENLFSPRHGTLTYPTDTATFANNAADLVEFRVKPLPTQTAFRITLNTLKDPAKTAITVALGNSAAPLPWPHGANVVSPAQYFVTVHGTTGELRDAATGQPVTPAPTVAVDLARRQIDVRVAHQAWDPGDQTVRMSAGVGLWNTTTNTYLQPGPVATATSSGGRAANGAALFNLAFRTQEPVPHIYDPGIANTIVEGHATVLEDGSYWRERRQGDALASGDVSSISAEVDFAKLAKGVDDDSGVPKHGHLDRIFASRHVFGQGVDYTVSCLTSQAPECTGRQLGQLQPYALYVPEKPLPAKGFGLVVSMHGLSANYNEFLGSHEAEQLGERGTGSIVASPQSRGPDGSYKSYAEADVFEMWADVARHYTLNPDLTDVSGYSMGGGGTYRLATKWPDLWARAFPIVGPPTGTESFKSLRNIPVMAWYAQTDELVGPEMSEEAFLNALGAGLRYDHWIFTPAGHITLGNNDEFGPAAVFLGDHEVDRNPPHVTYVVDPSTNVKAESPPDHAYWLSAIKLRASGTGTLDARSSGFGVGDPPVLSPKLSMGNLTGGSHPGGLPYQRRTLGWGPTPTTPKQNAMTVDTTNVVAVTIDASRAKVGCDVVIHLTSDGPTKLTMGGCDLAVSASAGKTKLQACVVSGRSFPIHLPGTQKGRKVTSAVVTVNGRGRRIVRLPHLTTRIAPKGLANSRSTVKIVSRLRGGRHVGTVRHYRICA